MGLLLELPAPVWDDAARQALAEAVSRHLAARADHAGTVAAAAAAEERVYAVRRQVDAAEEALREAPQAAADHQQALARGTAGPPPATARECREALADAEDELLAARSSRDLLQQRIPADAQRVSWAEQRCREAALAVMRGECGAAVAELLDELARAHEVVARLGRIADWLAGAGVIERTGPVLVAITRHTSPPCGWGWQDGRSDPAAGWHATLAMLQADAEAPSAVLARA